MQFIHILMFLLWRGLPGYSVSTTTHASNVSKRQLQFGPLSYTAYTPDGSQQTNAFMQSPQQLYDPGYNSQENHELSINVTNSTDAVSTGVTEQHDEQHARDARKFDTLPNVGVGGEAPPQAAQSFSHIYFPHIYAPSAVPALARTAPHIFPGETPAALAARNSGRSFSTSSTYFVPLSVLYHPNVGPYGQQHQPQHFVYPQQQMTQAYNPLPPPPPPPLAPTAFYQQYAAPQAILPPRPQSTPTTTLTTPPLHQPQTSAREPSQTLSQQAVYQQHGQQAAHAHTSHFPPLPPLPPLPSRVPQQLPRTSPSTPLTQHFQAPFHPSQFLGFVPERDARNGGRIDVSASPYLQTAVSYSQQQQEQQQQQQQQQRLVKPIYERSVDAKTGDDKQQNYQTAVTPQAPYGRYVYMAPNSGYALFKAA